VHAATRFTQCASQTTPGVAGARFDSSSGNDRAAIVSQPRDAAQQERRRQGRGGEAGGAAHGAEEVLALSVEREERRRHGDGVDEDGADSDAEARRVDLLQLRLDARRCHGRLRGREHDHLHLQDANRLRLRQKQINQNPTAVPKPRVWRNVDPALGLDPQPGPQPGPAIHAFNTVDHFLLPHPPRPRPSPAHNMLERISQPPRSAHNMLDGAREKRCSLWK